MVKGPHVAVFEAAVRVRQSIHELSGPREALVGLVEELEDPVLQAAAKLAEIGPQLGRYLRAAEACDNVAIPERRTLLAFGDEKRVPGGTVLAAETRELMTSAPRMAELLARIKRRLDERRPDVLRCKMLTDQKGERAALISAMADLDMGPIAIAEALNEAPPAPAGRDKAASVERREAADAVSDVLS